MNATVRKTDGSQFLNSALIQSVERALPEITDEELFCLVMVTLEAVMAPTISYTSGRGVT